MKKARKHVRKPVAHYPAELERNGFTGNLYGYFFADSNEYNVVHYGDDPGDVKMIGTILKDRDEARPHEDQLVGYRENGDLVFKQGNRTCRKKPYELLLNIYSRNSGILETGRMMETSCIVSGCGSVGSLVALELARAGVGSFLLVDNDTFDYHNICRHQCGIRDVGKYKVEAVKERILQINPKAAVFAKPTILENISEAEFDAVCSTDSIIVSCADNRECDLWANRISQLYKVPFVSIGFWERACAGEVFYSIPGETPCYNCQFSYSNDELSGRSTAGHRFYSTQENLEDIMFEPGISADINFVTIIGIKIIIDLLNRNTSGYIPKLLGNLSQYTLICNTNDERIACDMAGIFAYPLQVTTSIQVDRNSECPTCECNDG